MPGAENFPELRPVALPSQATVCFLSVKYWWLEVIQENSASGGGGVVCGCAGGGIGGDIANCCDLEQAMLRG